MGVIKSYSCNGSAPVTVGGTGTPIKYFADLPPQNIWNTSAPGVNSELDSAQKGAVPSATSNKGGLTIPGPQLNGNLFWAVASGNILFGAGEASTTGKVGMYLSTASASSAVPNYQTLIELTITNQALDGVYYPWTLAVDFQGDTLSGILQLVKSGGINGTITTATQVTALTGISFASDPAFTLVIGVTFGASIAGNSANMYQFYAAQD